MTDKGLAYMIGWMLGFIAGAFVFVVIADWPTGARFLAGAVLIGSSILGAMRFS